MKQRVMLFQTAGQGLSRVLETAECGKLGLGDQIPRDNGTLTWVSGVVNLGSESEGHASWEGLDSFEVDVLEMTTGG